MVGAAKVAVKCFLCASVQMPGTPLIAWGGKKAPNHPVVLCPGCAYRMMIGLALDIRKAELAMGHRLCDAPKGEAQQIPVTPVDETLGEGAGEASNAEIQALMKLWGGPESDGKIEGQGGDDGN